MGEICSKYGREENYISLLENFKEIYRSEELGVNGWIITQYALTKADEMTCIQFISVRLKAMKRLLAKFQHMWVIQQDSICYSNTYDILLFVMKLKTTCFLMLL
jgi:hypothetical protein